MKDLYKVGEDSELYFGNCFDKFQYIKDGSIDLILCDLPFGTTRAKWDSVLDLEKLWIEYNRVIKENGAILLFAQTPFDKVLGCSNLKYLKYEWIWEKNQATGHLNAKKMPMKAHENILVFYKKLPTYNYIKTTGHVRKVSSKESRGQCIDRRNLKDDYIYNKECGDKINSYDSTERYPRSVLKFPSDKQKSALHPTQKPIKLLEYFIKTYSNINETILDNTAGSFSTGVACQNLNRKFIGMEKSREYFDIGYNRMLENLNSNSDI